MTDEPWGWDRIATELNFLEITRQAAKRTILCEPQREHQIRAAVDQHGAADIITVRASAACPEGQLLVIDEGAIEAANEEIAQGLRRAFWRYGGQS